MKCRKHHWCIEGVMSPGPPYYAATTLSCCHCDKLAISKTVWVDLKKNQVRGVFDQSRRRFTVFPKALETCGKYARHEEISF